MACQATSWELQQDSFITRPSCRTIFAGISVPGKAYVCENFIENIRTPKDTNGDVNKQSKEYDEDFDREWNDEDCTTESSGKPFIITKPTSLKMLSNGHSATNGFTDSNFDEEEEASNISAVSNMYLAAAVKMEPDHSFDEDEGDEEDDILKGRFNLRKRKVDFTPHSIFDTTNADSASDTGECEETGEKRKRKKSIYNYTTNMLQEALDLVRSQNISILNAAKQYGIPRSTLRRYALTSWSANTPKVKSKQETALSQPEEAHLVSMITKMSRAGKYVSTMDVKSTVQHLLDDSQRIVFKDRNRPNAGWVQRFRKRHRHLAIKGSGYTVKKNGLSKSDVEEWYNELTRYLTEDWNLEPAEFLSEQNSHRIFNLDEMNLPLNHKADLVEEHLPKTEEDSCNEITILLAVSANGDCMQPLIIQKGEGGGHEDDIMPLDQNSYGISFSISGKMNSDIFLRWLEAFDRELCEKGVQKPIVLFLDDLFSHFHISVFTYAIDNDIILLCTQTQVGLSLQPVEDVVSKEVKEAYRTFCKEFYRMENSAVSLDHFPLTFLRAFEAVRDREGLKESIRTSFNHMGIIPFTCNAPVFADFPSALDFSFIQQMKCEKSTKYKEPKAKTVPFFNENSNASDGLVPKVKIKKLSKSVSSNDYKIVDGFSPTKEGDSPDSFSSFSNMDSRIKIEPNRSPQKAPRYQNSLYDVSEKYLSLERLEGRQDGVKKCLDLMQSFIPADLLPVWNDRSSDELKTSSEVSFCMWKTVHSIFDDISYQIERQSNNSYKNSNSSKFKGTGHKKK